MPVHLGDRGRDGKNLRPQFDGPIASCKPDGKAESDGGSEMAPGSFALTECRREGSIHSLFSHYRGRIEDELECWSLH